MDSKSQNYTIMAANRSVTVLAPNGRRQTVKITPNSTILQILEEVCLKHGYSPQKWDIKHTNQVLDVSSIFRFTGLPNNAQLEMTPRDTERAASNVTIGLQLESGERLMGDFTSTSSLSDIIGNLCPAQHTDNTVVIYMHQEIHGKDSLQNTTLQSLGINNGRAMLRLLHRDLNKLNTQAHVSRELAPKPHKANEKSEKNSKKGGNNSVTNQIKKVLDDPLSLIRAEKNNSGNKNNKGNSLKKPSIPTGGGHVLGRAERKPSVESTVHTHMTEETMETTENRTPLSDIVPEEPIDFLGERNALLFNQAGAKAVPREDLPDNFFDLTHDDARALLRDAKRHREQLEEAPLTTSAQRELDRNKATLNKLHKYRKSIIRIQFPNQIVLQGIFGPLETVQMVKDFVKDYLAHPEQEFVLYCTPPRKELNPSSRLVDENLVPSAIIYYSGVSELKSNLHTKLVDPKIASVQAIKSRITMTRTDTSTDNEIMTDIDAPVQGHESPCAGTSTNISSGESSGVSSTDKLKSYTPKWFKNAFK